jgi:predicted nucleic acid-binding protein
VDNQDVNYEAALRAAEQLSRERSIWLITNFIIAEAYGLILLRLGRHVAFSFLRRFLQSVADGTSRLEHVTEEDEARAWVILETYDDQPFSYVDATTFAVMERLGVRRAFAFDRHFDIVRLKGRHPVLRIP